MPVDIKITDSEIELAEKILLPDGNQFDTERRNFIMNLETCDLQAVPGSGKTTALLAKLLILEKHLPFKDGSGILVLSHTNSAIDEIKDRIAKYCPRLFAYPNFVGTIQSFVDEYLAIPFYHTCFRSKIVRIDDLIYEEQVERYFKQLNNFNKMKNYVNRKKEPLKYLNSIRFDLTGKLILELNQNKNIGVGETTDTYKEIMKMKNFILYNGFLHFDDAYILANIFIQKATSIVRLLQNRFKLIYVDEMQDMMEHQYKLLEKIFYEDGNSKTIFQRIGDKNQAIFNGDVKLSEIWKARNRIEIKGSLRLSPTIANVVKFFGLDFQEIEGWNKNDDGSEINIKPHLIVYDDNSIRNVIPKFAKIIKEYQDDGKIPQKPKYPFKAIAWRKDLKEAYKIGLSDYWKDFNDDELKPKIEYNNLKTHIYQHDKNDKSFKLIRKNIINAILKILRLEGIKTEKDRYYNEYNLINLIKEKDELNSTKNYELYNKYMFCWCFKIAQEKKDFVLKNMQKYIQHFLKLNFNKNMNYSREFFFSSVGNDNVVERFEINKKSNSYKIDDLEIEIGTVHSAKGQTHTCTLYMETYFYQDGKGAIAKSYESQRLSSQFALHRLNGLENERTKQSAKMVYVGFSRPTHLLCFAVHTDRYEAYLKDNINDYWIVEHL